MLTPRSNSICLLRITWMDIGYIHCVLVPCGYIVSWLYVLCENILYKQIPRQEIDDDDDDDDEYDDDNVGNENEDDEDEDDE